MNPPSPDFQLQFLDYLQRLLDGGMFTATYKYALLMALADLSVEKGADNDQPLPLSARDVAEKFIAYYSRQASPFPGALEGEQAILHQNTGGQAAVINHVREAIPLYGSQNHSRLVRRLQADRGLVSRVTRTVIDQPLWKLQTIGNQTDDFLYPCRGSGPSFELRPGIAFCFRKFHGFIYRLAQDGWLRFVRDRHQNQHLLGDVADLNSFMFGNERQPLEPYRPILREIQEDRCFYCHGKTGAGHIDHFVPWSWYSLDLGHNFVLACDRCNQRKKDHLAAPAHLRQWLLRNEEFHANLISYFECESLPHHRDSSLLITRWAYGRVAASNGVTWVQGKDFERISLAQGWTFPSLLGNTGN